MPAPLRSLPPPAKKRKLSDDTDLLKSISTKEKQLTAAISSNTSINALADLVKLATTLTESAEATSKAIYALYRVFVLIINDGKLRPQEEGSKVIRTWIWERLNTYVDFLGGLLQDEEKMLRMSALQILFSLLKHLSTSATLSDAQDEPQMHVAHFRRIIAFLLFCPPSSRSGASSNSSGTERQIQIDVRDTFVETYAVHDDIRWFFLRDAGSVLYSKNADPNPLGPANLLSIMEKLPDFPNSATDLQSWFIPEFSKKPAKLSAAPGDDDEDQDQDDDGAGDEWWKFFEEPTKKESVKVKSTRLHKMSTHQALYALNSHKAVFTKAWLGLLPMLSRDAESSKGLSVRVLNIMHRGVLPYLTRPVLVMDWVASCVEYGGTAGLLALNALFVLMRDYNLDYPSFYTRLYTFLDRDVLHVKHRARFFRLTELFLSSTHIPATLLASFVKRLSRLSLHASPSAIVMTIPFIYNILKRHPALMVMVHRDPNPEGGFNDPFDPSEPNPIHTHAIDSSLWELASHRTHYHSAVSTLAKIFAEPFTKPGFSMEDFLDHTYGTLIETDTKRRVKKDPPLSMELELQGKDSMSGLFPTVPLSGEEEGAAMRDVVSELWVF